MSGKVLLVDDEEHLRVATAQSLELAGMDVAQFTNAQDALAAAGPDLDGIVVSDILMPGMTGTELYQHIRVLDPDLPVILITGHGDIPMAVEAMRAGVYDFIEKPFAPERLVDAVRRALEKRRLVLENRALRASLDGGDALEAMVAGRSAAMVRLREQIRSFAITDVDVLIEGETGTGKELAARALHEFSPRADGRFVALNCGALPEHIIESELFGHEAGAFAGADRLRLGKFEYADGGTLFLDEIENMPADMQVRLLRVLQERRVVRLGSNQENPVDVRIVAASKENLLEASTNGKFRSDLFYRLNILKLTLPPLRARHGDISLLFARFARSAAAQQGREPREVPPELLARLESHDWPGNVRELQNVALRFVLGLELDNAPGTGGGGDGPPPLADQLARIERDIISRTIVRNGGSLKASYEQLGISRKTLYDKMQRLGIAGTSDAD